MTNQWGPSTASKGVWLPAKQILEFAKDRCAGRGSVGRMYQRQESFLTIAVRLRECTSGKNAS